MKSAVADTNIFLRFLTNDVPEQANKVEKRFKQAQTGKLTLHILPITIVEILFQLENWYKLDKQTATDRLIKLFSPEWMQIEHKASIFEALYLYTKHNIDFVDLITWTIAKNNNHTILSFDKDFSKLSPNLQLTP